MENPINSFTQKLAENGLSENTIKSYTLSLKNYLEWFNQTYHVEFKQLYRENILEYKSYLKNIRRSGSDQHHLDAKTINHKLSALAKYNTYFNPENTVITEKDYMKIQENYINPTDITKDEIEQFRQKILQSGGLYRYRDYAISTIMAYGGLRISEVLALKINDVNVTARQIKVSDGKGEKQRIVIINEKIVNSLSSYYKTRSCRYSGSEYLFCNTNGAMLNRTTINKAFSKYSDHITPHTLRHFYCTNALESGAFSVQEVAQQAGHADIKTTMRYIHPNLKAMIQKVDSL